MERRRLLGLLGLGTVALVTGCGNDAAKPTAAGTPGASLTPAASLTPTPSVGDPSVASSVGGPSGSPSAGSSDPGAPASSPPPSASLPGIPDAVPGATTLLYAGPTRRRQFALTIDDGYDPETVAGYVDFARRTGIPITFSPNGSFQAVWHPHREALRPLIEAGQVQIGNHTFSHKNMLRRTDAQNRADLEKNEAWIQRTFGITSRPYLRPPYGARDARTDAVAGSLGYTSILMWNGTLGDSTAISPTKLIDLAYRYLRPGTILLGHANHPTVLGLLDQIESIITDRQLRAVTLDTMFGTSRDRG